MQLPRLAGLRLGACSFIACSLLLKLLIVGGVVPCEGHCHASVFGVGDVFDIVVPAIAAGHALVALVGGRAGLAQSGDS